MRYPFNVTVNDISVGPNLPYGRPYPLSGIKQALANLDPFRHNGTMTGGWNETGDTYYVFSYRTCIAWVNVHGEHWFNPERYSVTTSKQQGMVRTYLLILKGEYSSD